MSTDPSSGTREVASLTDLRDAVNECRRCDRWRAATQGVPGEGRAGAPLMLVGEVPGDAEDLAGHPFVGPAGALLDRALDEAGIERHAVFITNAVKHFKFKQRGKRRLHVKPTIGEIKACHFWLAEELRLVRPKLVLALGATAARGVLGHTVTVAALRGRPLPLTEATHAWVTVHPSYLLRIPDEAPRRAEYARFVRELEDVNAWVREP
ncbi:MAG TPA: UdgX family uracil-DNA binding protein [Steroidobacteraceae bacterium]|nr:UdgX family uracil-DNA binding protein [Steroidobacteraceae bacterium]